MVRTRAVAAIILGVAAISGSAHAQVSRDTIRIVGSSTVYPFATVVAQHLGKASGFETPTIESTGSGGGFKLFCAGVGAQHPDIANASRAMLKPEFDACQQQGVTEIVEVKIGFDGITVAHSAGAKPIALTRKELWLALARQVPDPDGGSEFVPNPYQTWKQLNPALPDHRIEVLGPPLTSGTRDSFVELVLEVGCNQMPQVKAMATTDAQQHKAICQTMREDGGYVEIGENDSLIVQKLVADPNAIGIFGYSFLDQNRDTLQAVPIEGVKPATDTIATGKYAISRPLYFYVKKAHLGLIPGIREYVAEFTSLKAWGPKGYLAARGLIPLPDGERKVVSATAREMIAIQ